MFGVLLGGGGNNYYCKSGLLATLYKYNHPVAHIIVSTTMATIVHRKKQGSGHDEYHDVDLGVKDQLGTPEKGRRSKRFEGKAFSLVAGVVLFVYYIYFGALRYTLRGTRHVFFLQRY